MTDRKFLLSQGIVQEAIGEGQVSHDIFDALTWPGGQDEGYKMAKFIHASLNRHSNMLQATLELCATMEQHCANTGTDWIGSGIRNAIAHVRTTLIEYGMSVLPNTIKDFSND